MRGFVDRPRHWRVVDPLDLDGDQLRSWRALTSSTAIDNPCMEPEFLLPAARHIPELRALRLLILATNQQFIALVPSFASARMGRVPVVPGVRCTWDGAFLGEPAVAPGYEAEAAERLLAYLAETPGISWLRLETLDADGGFAGALTDRVRRWRLPAEIRASNRGFATRRAEPTYLTDRRHENLRRLGRQRQAFERSTGQPLRVIDRSGDVAAVDEFLTLEAAGWKGSAGVAHLARPGRAAFLRDLCQGFRERGTLRLWSLVSGDRTLAMKLNIISGDTLFCAHIAFDEAYSRVSPGLQLEVQNFALFHDEQRVRAMDSCASAFNTFANRLYPERRSLLDITIGSGVLGHTLMSAVPVGRRLARTADSLRQRISIPEPRRERGVGESAPGRLTR